MAFNFGVDQNDVMLTMVSFASQHEFFNLLGLGADGTLAWIAYTCGLIGFLMLVALPASWDIKNILAWLTLFLIVLVRPLGEPLFFSDPIADESVAAVDETVCFGNVLNNRECQGMNLNVEGLKAGDVIEEQSPIDVDINDNEGTFKMFTPQAAVIDVINDLHYGVATQLNDLGPRVLDRQFAALETLRRNSTGNTYSAYAIADFLASCGARDPDMARVASLSSDKVIERYPDLWGRMAETQLIFADGIQMFRNFDAFRRGQSQETQNMLYPSLICAPGKCAEGGAINAFDQDPNQQITPEELNNFTNSILYNAPTDFVRIAEPGAPATEDTDRVQSGVEKANINLTAAMGGLGDDAIRRMMSQKVSMIVPINIDAALQGNRLQSGGDLSPYRDLYSQVAPVLEGAEEAVREQCPDVRTERARPTASLLERVGRGLLRGREWLRSKACSVAVGVVGFAARTQARGATFLAEPFIGPKVEFGDDEPAYVVANCAQMHMISNLRHNTASADLQMFGQDLEDLMEENEEILATQNFEGLPPKEQTALVLQTIMDSRASACVNQHPGNENRQQACIQNRNAQLQEMAEMNSEISAAAAHPMAEIMIENVSDPDYVNASRDLANAAGQATSGFFIGLKAMIGGFGSGTYSEIMPRIVTFAVSLMIIMTPLIFMIGLIMPTWSFGILVMSIVVIAYFLLTKVVFSMISIVMTVFVAGREFGVVSYELGNFADLVVGSAYTSAFILTGLFMFSLKNPLAAIQQVAGAADKASTVSGAEALAAAMTVVKGAKVVAGVATGGAGAAAALGSMSSGGGGGGSGGGGPSFGDAVSGVIAGYDEGKKGGFSGLISGDSAKAAREASMSKIAVNVADRQDAQTPPKTQEHYNDVERGRRMKADSEESALVAKANGYSGAFKDEEAIIETNNHKHPIKVDGKGASIESAFQKIGKNGEPVREVMRAKQLHEGAKTIKDSGGREGRVEHKYDISVFENNSSATRADFQQMAEKQLGKLLDASGDITTDINKATHFLRVESKGTGGED